MAKFVPQRDAFKWVLGLDKTSTIIIWIVFFLSLAPFVIDKFKLDLELTKITSEVIQITNIFLLVFGFVINAIKDYYLFPLAETIRRRDLMDNSFGSKYSIENSDEYYTNDEINEGISKLGVNLFQNVYFTTTISKKMRLKYIVKSGLFLVVFIWIAIYGLKNSVIALSVLQLMFSAFVFGDLIKLLFFVQRNQRILENMQSFFSGNNQTEAEIMKNFTEYETNLAWGMILLDEKIFNKYNDKTEEQWQKIKQKYGINNG